MLLAPLVLACARDPDPSAIDDAVRISVALRGVHPSPEELEGLRTCAADGSAFGECDCSPGAVSQGPLPTGSESGTGDSGSGTAEDSGSGTGGATSMGSTTDPDPTTSGGSNGSTGPGGSSGSSTG